MHFVGWTVGFIRQNVSQELKMVPAKQMCQVGHIEIVDASEIDLPTIFQLKLEVCQIGVFRHSSQI